ncbi:hypothetical protein SKAU_G00009240 [Synaphobranchus kaupii]|uniref:Uncharacterized protein n=1 Tax=Synaphobranchus kaupii TaxID=118154 RepID=A0A9Q1G9Q1_SYNKA|nr:hypothetical protein SKAU_G00009240 [Synaphobranchus kaupii]
MHVTVETMKEPAVPEISFGCKRTDNVNERDATQGQIDFVFQKRGRIQQKPLQRNRCAGRQRGGESDDRSLRRRYFCTAAAVRRSICAHAHRGPPGATPSYLDKVTAAPLREGPATPRQLANADTAADECATGASGSARGGPLNVPPMQPIKRHPICILIGSGASWGELSPHTSQDPLNFSGRGWLWSLQCPLDQG